MKIIKLDLFELILIKANISPLLLGKKYKESNKINETNEANLGKHRNNVENKQTKKARNENWIL